MHIWCLMQEWLLVTRRLRAQNRQWKFGQASTRWIHGALITIQCEVCVAWLRNHQFRLGIQVATAHYLSLLFLALIVEHMMHLVVDHVVSELFLIAVVVLVAVLATKRSLASFTGLVPTRRKNWSVAWINRRNIAHGARPDLRIQVILFLPHAIATLKLNATIALTLCKFQKLLDLRFAVHILPSVALWYNTHFTCPLLWTIVVLLYLEATRVDNFWQNEVVLAQVLILYQIDLDLIKLLRRFFIIVKITCLRRVYLRLLLRIQL